MNRTRADGRISAGTLALVAVAAILGVLAGEWWKGRHTAPTASAQPAAAKQLWTCSMHPQVIQDHPGLCPICHMELVPLRAAPAAGASPTPPDGAGGMPAVTIEPAVVQNMGVREAVVQTGDVVRTVRAAGTVREAEPSVHEVNLRVSGWIEKLYADTEGLRVKRGEPLFDLYSPEVTVAAEELIRAKHGVSGASAPPDGAPDPLARLADAARRRLMLWGLTAEQVDQIGATEAPPRTVAILSPADGEVERKMVVAGAAVKAGDLVMRIVDRSVVWVDARVYERDLPLVKPGLPAAIVVDGHEMVGEVSFVSPRVDEATRAAVVRVSVPNEGLALRPGMYATVRLRAMVASGAVVIDRGAVLDSGERKVVFVALGGGRFEPRQVSVGAEGDGGMVEVVSGVKAGERVVTSGQFLMDSESRLKEAIARFLGGEPHAEAQRRGEEKEQIRVGPVVQETIDAVVAAYLTVAEELGKKQEAAAPVDVGPLADAATALSSATKDGEAEPLAAEVAAGIALMKSVGTDAQREAFKRASAAVIALVERMPPSERIAGTLYRVHCPMALGDWLQRDEEVKNPYYATTMKACGEVVGKVAGRKPRRRKRGIPDVGGSA